MSAARAAEQLLGRRLRPWWGTSPYRLIGRGTVQGVLLGVLAYGCLRLVSGGVEVPADLPVAPTTIRTVALVALAIAVLGMVYSVLRVVVGLIDVASRTTVSGVVVSLVDREHADFLSPAGRMLLRIWEERRSGHVRHRPSRRQLTMETAAGRQTWTVSPRFGALPPGTRASLTTTSLLGHVTRID